MKFDLSKKRTITLLALLNLLLVLPLIFMAIKEKQEIRKKAAGTEVIKLTLAPASQTVNPGDEFEIKVQLANNGNQEESIRVAGVSLSFNSQLLTISELACANDFPAEALPENSSPPSPPGFGVVGNKIYLTCFRFQDSQPQEPLELQPGDTVNLGSFQVKVKDDATANNAEISFTRTNIPHSETLTNLADTGQDGHYQISGTSSSISASVKIKFIGVNEKKSDQKLKIKLGRTNEELMATDSLNAIADNQGVFTSENFPILPEIEPGSNYFLLVKGPKHLQNKYQNLSLQEGNNQFNLTSSPLLPGDLPHPVYSQDGIVNAFDAVLLVGCFKTPESQTCLDQADLNFDGIINSTDMNLINLTIMKERWEDE